MRAPWGVELIRRVHHFLAEGRRRVLEKRDVISQPGRRKGLVHPIQMFARGSITITAITAAA
jgi:hypothetical protein